MVVVVLVRLVRSSSWYEIEVVKLFHISLSLVKHLSK
jgi:hypothetical protein